MIAIDAGELSLIRASLSSLPTFRRLFEEAALLPLRSSAEHIAASVWPTMYTGRSAGEHGISQHIQWDPQVMRMRRISSDWVYSEPFWYDLARAGLGVTVLDVPFAFENCLPQAGSATRAGLRRPRDRRGRQHHAGEITPMPGHYKTGHRLSAFVKARQTGYPLKGGMEFDSVDLRALSLGIFTRAGNRELLPVVPSTAARAEYHIPCDIAWIMASTASSPRLELLLVDRQTSSIALGDIVRRSNLEPVKILKHEADLLLQGFALLCFLSSISSGSVNHVEAKSYGQISNPKNYFRLFQSGEKLFFAIT